MEILIIGNILLSASGGEMFIIILLSLLGLVGLPLLIRFTEKISGTTTIVRGKTSNRKSALQRARKETAEYEKQLIEKMKKMNPEIVKQAQDNIINSVYANTIQNIYSEAVKLERTKKINNISNKLSNSLFHDK